MGTLNNLNDIDLCNGEKSIKNLAKEVKIALSKQFSVEENQMSDGHISLSLGEGKSSLKIDFSSNFIEPNIKGKNISNIMKEAYSRDFFCNTLLMSFDLKKIQDPTKQGIQDIKNKVIRTCLDPDITLRSNTNRIPRVIYLAAKLGFSVDPQIIDWIKTHKELISTINPSYLTKTLNKALQYNKAITVKLLDEMELWKSVPIPEALYPEYAARFTKTAQWRKNFDYGEGLYFGEMDRSKSVSDFLKKRKKKQKKEVKKLKEMSKNAYFEAVEDGFDSRVWLENDWIVNDEDPIRMDRYENKESDGTPIKKEKEEVEKEEEEVPEEQVVLQPAPFYEDMYSSQHGVNGLYSSPLEYPSGAISEEGYTLNPWSKTYQMAQISPQTLHKLSTFFYSCFHKLA